MQITPVSNTQYNQSSQTPTLPPVPQNSMEQTSSEKTEYEIKFAYVIERLKATNEWSSSLEDNLKRNPDSVDGFERIFKRQQVYEECQNILNSAKSQARSLENDMHKHSQTVDAFAEKVENIVVKANILRGHTEKWSE